MVRYVVIAFMLVNLSAGAPPLRLTVDCSDERVAPFGAALRSKYDRSGGLDMRSFCSLIHNALPRAVHDGRFILVDPDLDQEGFSDTRVSTALAPPRGFIPEWKLPEIKVPRLRIPKLNVPKLQARVVPHRAPRIGSPMTFTSSLLAEENSSAEKMEKLKKGVQKMLHFVKVLGQIDQYLSDRIRIVVDKVSKTFSE